MMTSQFRWQLAGASLVLLASISVRTIAEEPAAANQPGVLWESTSQTVMEGLPMQMPVQKMKICSAKQWTQPPAGGDQSCTNTDFKIVGSKATWTVQCTGEMEMTGVGEITFDGPDSYSGAIKFTSEEVNMTVKLTGRKIGGCDNPR
jgi:hypothetical protein